MRYDPRINVFKEELDKIENVNLREFTYFVFSKIQPRFFREPASSTGKYHPQVSLGVGGLVRHTKLVFKFAEQILKSGNYDYAGVNHDVIYVACLLHDTYKYHLSYTPHTLKYHAKKAYEEIFVLIQESGIRFNRDDAELISRILKCILYHNGKYTNECENPHLMTQEERVVALADWLSAQKEIFIFVGGQNEEKETNYTKT